MEKLQRKRLWMSVSKLTSPVQETATGGAWEEREGRRREGVACYRMRRRGGVERIDTGGGGGRGGVGGNQACVASSSAVAAGWMYASVCAVSCMRVDVRRECAGKGMCVLSYHFLPYIDSAIVGGAVTFAVQSIGWLCTRRDNSAPHFSAHSNSTSHHSNIASPLSRLCCAVAAALLRLCSLELGADTPLSRSSARQANCVDELRR